MQKTVSSIEYIVYSEEKTKEEMDSRFRGNDKRGAGMTGRDKTGSMNPTPTFQK